MEIASAGIFIYGNNVSFCMSDSDNFGEYRQGRFEMTSDNPGKTTGSVGGPAGTHEVVYDEPEPLGNGEHPTPVTQMFGSLVACQISVLSQCLKKARIDEYSITAEAEVDQRETDEIEEEMPSNTAKRIRHITIDLQLEVPEEHKSRAKRCLDVYDTGCIVGQSFRAGIKYTPQTNLVISNSD